MNLQQLKNELADLTGAADNAEKSKAELEKIKDIYFAARRKVDGLRREEADVRSQITSIPRRLLATLLSLVSPAHHSASQLEEEHRTLVRKLHSAESSMDEQKARYVKARASVRRLGQPVDSVRFAAA